MKQNKSFIKPTVAVIFGGRSVEHDISIITGVQTLNKLDKNKFNIIPIYISKNGDWLTSENFFNIKNFSNPIKQNKNTYLITITNNGELYKKKGKKFIYLNKIFFVFFALHGGIGEDGSVQGYIESLKIPHSSSGVLSSALCMNKLTTKDVLYKLNIKTVKHLAIYKNDFSGRFNDILDKLKDFNFPLIVKPCSLGSSIGINFCKNKNQLKNAVNFAFMFDDCVLIEEVVSGLREFNIAVMGNSKHQELSDIEEVFSASDFLTFENKYLKNNVKNGIENTNRVVPANLSEDIKAQIKECALKAFVNLNCKGIVRIDFLYSSTNKELYLNEINTIPGSLANYLWKTKNYNFKDILNKLYEYGIEQFNMDQKNIINFSSNVLSQFEDGAQLKLIK